MGGLPKYGFILPALVWTMLELKSSCCHAMKMGLGYRIVVRSGDFVLSQEKLIGKVQEVRIQPESCEWDAWIVAENWLLRRKD